MTNRPRGFSLLELLAAMAIAALGMAIAAPPVSTMLDKISFRREVNDVMAQVRGWKLLAVSKGKAVTITLEGDVLVVQLGREERERKTFPEGVTVALEPNHILFSPEGWATPATIEISKEKRRRKVQIAPLTGRPQKI